MYRPDGPCGRGKDDALGAAALPGRRGARARPRGPRRRLSGHGAGGARARHHGVFRAGGFCVGGHGVLPAGHAGPHRFRRGDGARAAGARLRRARGELRGGRAGPHGNAVAAAARLRRAGVPLPQQARPAGGRPAAHHGRAAQPLQPGRGVVRRLFGRGGRRAGRGGRRARRRSARTLPGGGDPAGGVARRAAPSGKGAQALPLLFRRSAARRGRAGIPQRHGAADADGLGIARERAFRGAGLPGEARPEPHCVAQGDGGAAALPRRGELPRGGRLAREGKGDGALPLPRRAAVPDPGGEGGRAVLRSGADRCARRGRRGRAGACAAAGADAGAAFARRVGPGV